MRKSSLEWETKLLSLIGVALAPVLTLLIDLNVLTSQVATDIGSIVAAILAGFHWNTYLLKRKANGRKNSA